VKINQHAFKTSFINVVRHKITTLVAVLVTTGVVITGIVSSAQAADLSVLPTNVGSLGDSGSVAYNAIDNGDTARNRAYSWTTGTESAVNSIFNRIKTTRGGSPEYTITVKAVPGQGSNQLVNQANQLVERDEAIEGAKPVEFTTLFIGANDVCRPTVASMTSPEVFEKNISDALEILDGGNSDGQVVKVMVASIMDIEQLFELGTTSPTTTPEQKSAMRAKWVAGSAPSCPTMLANPTNPAANADNRAIVNERINQFNAALQRQCAAHSNCAYDNGAVYSMQFTIDDLASRDYFHPGVNGQAKLASVTWDTFKTLYPEAFDGTSSPVDTTAPTVAITAPTAGSTVSGTTTLTANASDNVGVTSVKFYSGTTLIGNGVKSTSSSSVWSYSFNTVGTANGSYSFTAKAYDAAGNVKTSSAVSATINNSATGPDTTAPTVTITAPTAGSTVSGTTTLTANASDNIGVTSVKFYSGTTLLGSGTKSGSTWSLAFNTNTSSSPDGVYSFTAKANDAAGNVGTSPAVSATVNNSGSTGADTTAPSVAITSPAAGSTVAGTINLTANATDNVGVTNVRFYSGTTLLGSGTKSGNVWTLAFNTKTASNGLYSFTAKASDAAGNVTTSSAVSATVDNSVGTGTDTTAPFVSITSPTSGQNISGTVVLTASATDNVAIATNGVKFYADGSTTPLSGTVTKSGDTYSLSYNTSGVTGTHSFAAKATDTSGNVKTSAAVSVTVNGTSGGTVDTTAPYVSILNDPVYLLQGTEVLTASASDNVDVTSVKFYSGTTLIGNATEGYGNKWSYTFNTASYPDGLHTLTAKAYDAAGNVRTSTGVSLRIANGVLVPSNLTMSMVCNEDPNVPRTSTAYGRMNITLTWYADTASKVPYYLIDNPGGIPSTITVTNTNTTPGYISTTFISTEWWQQDSITFSFNVQGKTGAGQFTKRSNTATRLVTPIAC
jgi:hypothetical protein